MRIYTQKIQFCYRCPSFLGGTCAAASFKQILLTTEENIPSWCPLPIYDARSEAETANLDEKSATNEAQ